MIRKSRAELEKDAMALGLSLSYMPEPVITNIFSVGEEEWQKTMREGIGSSGAAAAIGKSQYKTATEVALEKAYGKSKPIGTTPDKQFMLDCGHQMEVAILKWYAASLGYVVALSDPRNPSTSDIKDVTEITEKEWTEWEGQGIVCVDHARYRHPEFPFMFTDMDGVIFTPEREMYVAECKTNSSSESEYKWNWRSGVWGEPNVSVGNIGYIDQARHHMAVANADRCDIIVANGFNASNIVIVTVFRDMQEEKKLIDSEAALWKLVEDGKVPSFTTISDRTYENISYIIAPEDTREDAITFPEANRSIIKEIFQLESEIDDIEKKINSREERINALKVELIKNMGDHTLAVMPGFSEGKEIKLEIKRRQTTTFDRKRFELENPDKASAYLKTSIGDPKLSVSEVKVKAKRAV